VEAVVLERERERERENPVELSYGSDFKG